MNCAETFQPSLPAALPANACFAIVAPAGAARLDTQGCILFIEDVNEPLYRVDRLLTQLRLAGKLEGVKGVLVGDFAGITTCLLYTSPSPRDS